MVKSKKKKATTKELNEIFRLPIFYPSCATLTIEKYANLPSLDMSFNRGGKATLEDAIFSEYGDPNIRVLGINTKEPKSSIKKEDIIVFNKKSGTKTFYGKGKYQRINPKYKNTHYKKTK